MTGYSGSAARCGLLVLLLGLTGCMTTRYGPYSESRDAVPFLERRVGYQVTGAFHRDPPACAVVLPLGQAPSARHAQVIEGALARHLRQRLPRVVGPFERQQAARKLALDMSHPQDRRLLAGAADCPALIEARLSEFHDDYAVIYARRSMGLDVVMIRAEDEALLWRARHVAMRADGGLPVSPASLAASGAAAAYFHADKDMTDSLADDAARRIALSLPDVR